MIVKYSKKFPYAPYLNEDIGFELEVRNGDVVSIEEAALDALGILKKIAEKFHKENNPQLYEQSSQNGNNEPLPFEEIPINRPIPSKDISEERKIITEMDVADIIDEIEHCNTIRDVAKYKYLANQSDHIKKHYLNKLKQFV